MKNKIIKISIVFFIMLAITMTAFIANVNAANLQENTNANDKTTDTIADGTIIIGVSKFTPGTIITGVKAATAGANDMKVYALKNGNTDGYQAPKMYYYVLGEWMEYNEDGSLKSTSELGILDIYYVNNKLKQGISLPTPPTTGGSSSSGSSRPVTYTVFFVDQDVTGKQVVTSQTNISSNKELSKLTLPTKDGYTPIFKDNNETEISLDTKITKDMVLFVEWKLNKKVTLNMSGKAEDIILEAPEGTQVDIGISTIEKAGITYQLKQLIKEDGTEVEVTENKITIPDTDTTYNVLWGAVVDTEEELRTVLTDENSVEISVEKSIENMTSPIVVSRNVNLHGKDSNKIILSFAELNEVGQKSGLIIQTSASAGTTISNLTVAMTQKEGWQGNYAIQVYDVAGGVTLKDITATNSDAGLLANGSKVTLLNNINLTDNEFGGIEVSKGTGLSTNSELIATEATINMNNESETCPVIWVINGEGSVTGVDYTTKITEDNKIYYFTPKTIDFTTEENSIIEKSTTFRDTFYNKSSNQTITTVDDNTYYVDLGEYTGIANPTALKIEGHEYTNANANLSVGNNSKITVPVWKISNNNHILVALPWLCIEALPKTETKVSVGGQTINVKLYDEEVTADLSINSAEIYDIGNESKASANFEGNTVTMTRNYGTEAIALTFKAGETAVDMTTTTIFRMNTANMMDVGFVTNGGYAYVLYPKYFNGAVTEEKTINKTYKLALPGKGVSEVVINCNDKIPTEEVTPPDITSVPVKPEQPTIEEQTQMPQVGE